MVAAARPIDDGTTATLMANFYRAFAASLPVAVALQRSRLALRRRAPASDWASFRLIEP